jgi:hypothetical protein
MKVFNKKQFIKPHATYELTNPLESESELGNHE